MTRKSKIVISLTIIAIVIAVSGIAIAISGAACQLSPGSGNCTIHGFKSRSRGIPPFMQDEIGKFILWRMEQMADTLDLSSSQRDHFDKLKTNVELTWEKGFEAKRQMRGKTVQELNNQTPDLSALTTSIQKHMNTMADMMDTNLTLFNTLYTSLTADQKNVLNQKIKKRFDSHKEYCSYQR